MFDVARALPPPAITLATALPVRQFISSGDSGQEVGDDGTFRKLFIDALQGAEPLADINKDGYLTGTGLGQFLYNKMTNLTEQRQTPRYGKLNALGYDRGDFVFRIGELEAPSSAKPSQAAPRAPDEVAQLQERLARLEAELQRRQQPGDAAPQKLGPSLSKPPEPAPEGAPASSWWPWSSSPKPEAAKPQDTQTVIAETKPALAPKNTLVAVMAPPMPAPAPIRHLEEACEDSLLVSVAMGKKPCIRPGSGESFKDCPECPEMVVVPAGSFVMGSPETEPERRSAEGPQHKVTIVKPFAVGRFAVTFAEWDACVAGSGCGGYEPNDVDFGRGDHPVIDVSWNDAKDYMRWLSKKTGKDYRLLSEAEWEYVARAGTATPFWWGSLITPELANYDGTRKPYKGGGSKGEFRKKTMPVKSFKPNPWGLYQVHGNVDEWVGDCWTENYHNAPRDGSVNATGDCRDRVHRGGSWGDAPWGLRAAYRSRYDTVGRIPIIGFRVARTLD